MSTKSKIPIPNTRTWLEREIAGVERLLRDLRNRQVFRDAGTWRSGMAKHYRQRLLELKNQLNSLKK